MANFLRRVHRSAKLRSIAAKRRRLEAQLKTVGKKYKSTFKKECRRLRKRG